MPIKIRIADDSCVKEVNVKKVKVKELLSMLGLLSEEYIVVKGNEVITDEDEVVDGDEIVLYPVVSGG